jgi:plastocyanin
MPDWSIKIEGKPAVFTPDIDNIKPGTPLQVVQGDLVSWNNETDDPHFLVPDDPKYGVFMTAAITPDNPSGAYNVNAAVNPQTRTTTISYHCSLHDNEHGQIVVVDFGATDYGPKDLIA